MSPRRVLLLLAFFISGLAALLFETSWTRLLLLSLGTTATAVGAVLGAFMGGMAIGSALSTRPFLARRDPILVFAALEALIGAYALLSPAILEAVGMVQGQELRFALALVGLLPATAAMGASLPVLVRALGGERVSVDLGRLYAINTAGAVLGPILAVFALYPAVGLRTTLAVGAALDVLVAVALVLVHRAGSTDPAMRAVPETASSGVGAPWPVLLAVAVSGASAMVYEVAWGRTLSMVYGSSVYGVSIMLSTFLLGLSLGAGLATLFLKRRRGGDPHTRLSRALMASALLAFVSLLVARSLPFLFLNFYTSLEGRETTLFVSQFVIAALLMLPCSTALGATLPLAADALPVGAGGGAVARLYSWNLLGSALGAVAASTLLLSSFGLELTVRAAAVAVLIVAVVIASRAASFSVAQGAVAGSAILILIALDPSGEPVMKSFGIYSGANAYSRYDLSELRDIVARHQLLYYRDGPTASVAVQQIEQFRLLKINGKTDASNGPGDKATQLLLGHLPFMARDGTRVAVIGWGSGMTAGAVLRHPVERVDAFEIEPAVVEASRFFEPDNGKPLEDERLHLVMGDARSELRRGTEPYDIIISEPSNPWITGVSNLFTRDFFEIARARLAPDGIVCQWFHLYGMSEESTRTLIATFREVFPHAVAFRDRDLILIGSPAPLGFSLQRLDALYEVDEIRESLTAAEMRYPSDLLASMTLDAKGTEAFSEGATLNTDDNMFLELRAPRSLYRDAVEPIVTSMRRFPPDVMAHVEDVGVESEARRELAASYFTADRLEQALVEIDRSVESEPSFEAQKLRGQILERLGRSGEARQALEDALAAGGDTAGRRFVEAMLRSLDAPSGP